MRIDTVLAWVAIGAAASLAGMIWPFRRGALGVELNLLAGILGAILAGLLPIDALLHLTNIGTLFAFVIVCGAVLIMRKTNPEAHRPFRCPFVPAVPILGIAACLLLMLSLPAANWWRLIAWLGLGLVIYFGYGRRHSVLGMELRGEHPAQDLNGAKKHL